MIELSTLTQDEAEDLLAAGKLTPEQFATWCKKYAPDEDDDVERHRNGDFCEACGADRGDGYCQECDDDPDRPR